MCSTETGHAELSWLKHRHYIELLSQINNSCVFVAEKDIIYLYISTNFDDLTGTKLAVGGNFAIVNYHHYMQHQSSLEESSYICDSFHIILYNLLILANYIPEDYNNMSELSVELHIDSLKDNFDKIYVLYYARLHRFAKEYVLDNEDAENIVQDIFLHLWEKKDVLKIRTSLTSYLFSLVKNKCLDFLRHQLVIDEYKNDLTLKLTALELLNYTLSSEEDIERIALNAINKLPERCRLIFLKSRIEGKKHNEISDELGISVNTVENQIAIALKKLRVELKDFLPLFLFLGNC